MGFVFGHNVSVILDEASLLIERSAAAAYKSSIKSDISEPPLKPGGDTGMPPGFTFPVEPSPTPHPDRKQKQQFYGTIDLNPVKAKMDFAMIVDEVVEQFTSKLGVDVTISVEIQAKSKEGFDEAMQRTIKENCNVLKFNNAEFEDSE